MAMMLFDLSSDAPLLAPGVREWEHLRFDEPVWQQIPTPAASFLLSARFPSFSHRSAAVV
ncbi:MAG TPA: hypothetical protein VKR06_00030 [Ktedonosporobacter sp.]|nr:hypothetical protein [Ktedonosporobacter sp.]